MRVSTQGVFQQGVSLMQRLQSALASTQAQVASGRRLQAPSDDPIGSVRALELRESISRLDQFQRNSGIARGRLGQEDTALNTANNVLQRVRELTLQANNATQSNESRAFIGVEVRERLEELMQIANQKNGGGNYMFAGFKDATAPYTKTASGYQYNGDQGQRFVQVGDSRQVAEGDPGAAIFSMIRTGNGIFTASAEAANTGTGVLGPGSVTNAALYSSAEYTVRFIDPDNYEVVDSTAMVIATNTFQDGDAIAFDGIEFSISGTPAAGDEFSVAPSVYQDVFTTLDNLATTLTTAANDPAAHARQTNAINAGLANIDLAIGSVLEVRTQVGARLASLDTADDSNSGFEILAQQALGEIEDLDYAEALSQLSQQAATLEAAQQSFIRIQQLSLFNLL